MASSRQQPSANASSLSHDADLEVTRRRIKKPRVNSESSPEAKQRTFDWGKSSAKEDPKANGKNDKTDVRSAHVNFETTGLLAAESLLKHGVLLKHGAPIDAKKPKSAWRLYLFKRDKKSTSNEIAQTINIGQKSSYLFGKDSRVAEIPLIHPTVSKQHAVIQFRETDDDSVKPYVIDLESTNGTYLNGEKIDPARYVELRSDDVLRFGRSTREFLVLDAAKVPLQTVSYAECVEEWEATRDARIAQQGDQTK